MKERLRGADQHIHGEVSEFRAFTQAIDGADQALAEKCFQFADQSLAEANRALQNALIVSYLEDLDFQGRSRAFAMRLLTPRLASKRKAVLEYLDNITGRQKWSGEGPATPVSKVKRPKHGDAAQHRAAADAVGCAAVADEHWDVRPRWLESRVNVIAAVAT